MYKKFLSGLLLLYCVIYNSYATSYGCLDTEPIIPDQNSRCGSDVIFSNLNYSYPYWEIKAAHVGVILAGYAICAGSSSGPICYCRQLFPYFNAASEWSTGSYGGCEPIAASWEDISGCYTECAKACLLTIPDGNITWGYQDTASYELSNILQYNQFYR